MAQIRKPSCLKYPTLHSIPVSDRWSPEDNEILWPWLLRGIYEMKGGVVGRTVLMTNVVEYIKKKNYWGNERELEKYLRINAGDSYRHNLYKITRWMVDRDFLRPHAGFNEVSITRQGINMLGKRFPELQ
jgi:hypothetical protein